jgi:hypothetical protein
MTFHHFGRFLNICEIVFAGKKQASGSEQAYSEAA